jgi:hypothetical protein
VSGWDDPTGWPWYAVGICDRCNRRFPLHELIQDGNLPGLRVCREDWDELDPYRLPPREPDNLVLPFVRPDVPIAVTTCSHPFELPGFIFTEDGLHYFLTQDDIYVISEGISPILTEDGIELAAVVNELPACNELLIVEPWAS